MLFPVGDYLKPTLREMAAAKGLPIASKHDSMDLCFVADDDYRRFLKDWAAQAMQPGPIVTRAGKTLGEHGWPAGLHHRPAQGVRYWGSERAVLCA